MTRADTLRDMLRESAQYMRGQLAAMIAAIDESAPEDGRIDDCYGLISAEMQRRQWIMADLRRHTGKREERGA